MSLPANIDALAGAIENTTQRLTSTTSANAFLKLSKQGDWVYGAEETEVEDGSQWAVNPFSFQTGYACWGDGEMIDEAMALITDPPIIKGSLPQHPEGWSEQVSMDLVCISGDDEGTQVRYTATSLGGRKAFKALLTQILVRARESRDSVVPIITLEQDSYKHKKYGKIFTPVFSLAKWGSMDSLETEPAGKPAQITKQVNPEPEPEPVAEPAAPRRRSRRRA